MAEATSSTKPEDATQSKDDQKGPVVAGPLPEVFAYTLKIDGTEFVDFAETPMFKVTEGWNTTYKLTVQITSDKNMMNADDLIGKVIEVTITANMISRDTLESSKENGPHVFGGVVTEVRNLGPFHQGPTGGDALIYEMTAVPRFVALNGPRKSKVYKNMKSNDVAAALYRESGGGAVKNDGVAAPFREQLLRYQETDYDFMRRILQRDGINFRFVHTGGGSHDLKLVASGTGFTENASATLEFEVDHIGPGAEVFASHIGSVRTYDVNHLSWNSSTTGSANSSKAMSVSSGVGTDVYPGGTYDVDGGSNMSAYAAGLQHGYDTAAFTSNIYCARVAVQVDDCVAIKNTFDHNGGSTAGEFRVIGREMRLAYYGKAYTLLKLLPMGVNLGPPTDRVLPPERGMVIGVVAGDPGSDPQKLGRVQVNLTPKANDSTIMLCHAIRPWAGSQHTVQFDHLIGDEVVVAFLHDDPDRPTIVGALHNSVDKPPFDIMKEDGERKAGIRMRSQNELSFTEKSGSELFYMNAKKDMTAKVGNALMIDVTDKSTLKSNGDITIDGKANIVIQATSSIELKVGGSSIKIENGTITIKAPMLEVEGSGTATIKGGLVKIN